MRRIETGIPTNAEWAKAASWAGWFAKAMQTGAHMVVIAGGVIGIILLATGILAWRGGYGAGWDNRGYDGLDQREPDRLDGDRAMDGEDDNCRCS